MIACSSPPKDGLAVARMGVFLTAHLISAGFSKLRTIHSREATVTGAKRDMLSSGRLRTRSMLYFTRPIGLSEMTRLGVSFVPGQVSEPGPFALCDSGLQYSLGKKNRLEELLTLPAMNW